MRAQLRRRAPDHAARLHGHGDGRVALAAAQRARTCRRPSPPPCRRTRPSPSARTRASAWSRATPSAATAAADSWLPTVCPYATQCDACGFRENTREIEQRRHVRHRPATACARTAALAPRPSSTTRSTRTRGRRPTARSAPTRPTAAVYGPRTSQEISTEAFQGVTNETQPAPPPPAPQAPPSSPPPPVLDGSLHTCRALFYPDPAKPNAWLLDCCGTSERSHTSVRDGDLGRRHDLRQPAQLAHVLRRRLRLHAILWTARYLSTNPGRRRTLRATTAPSTATTATRARATATTDVHCVRNGGTPAGLVPRLVLGRHDRQRVPHR